VGLPAFAENEDRDTERFARMTPEERLALFFELASARTDLHELHERARARRWYSDLVTTPPSSSSAMKRSLATSPSRASESASTGVFRNRFVES
jgi:hypothetical protein